MKIQLDFMELILLQKINKNPGQVDWDSHPKIDRLMRVGLIYFLVGSDILKGKVIKVFISQIGKEVLKGSMPFQNNHWLTDDNHGKEVELWN